MFFFIDYNMDIVPPEYDSVVVSDFLFEDNKSIRGKKVQTLKAPFLGEDNFNRAYQTVIDISDRLCEATAMWLNRKYGIDFTKKQVKYIYGSFFIKQTYIILERYARVKDLNMGDLYFRIPSNEVAAISTPKYTDEYYNAYIYGQILKRLGAHEIGSDSDTDISVDRVNENMESLSGRIVTCVIDLFTQPKRVAYNLRRINGLRHMFVSPPRKNVFCNSLLIRTFMPTEIEGDIVAKSGGRVYSLDPNILIRKDYENYKVRDIDYGLRDDVLKDFCPQNDFEIILKEIISNTLPLSLCENFYSTYCDVQKVASRFTTNRIYSAARFDGAIAIFASIKSKEGAKIIDIQHSGCYISDVGVGYSEMNCFDEFITWGDYGEYIFGKAKIVAPVRFTAKRKVDKNIGGDIGRILFISNDPEKYDVGNGWYDPDFRLKHFSFIEALPVEYRKRLVVRLRNDSYGFATIYRNKYPEILLEYEMDCPMLDSIRKSDLIVIDINSSAYYESLIEGKPTLIFDGIKFPVYHEKMKKWIHRLSEKGLYRETGEEIAKIIVNNGDEIVNMWNEDDIQETLSGFLDYTMNSDVDIYRKWNDEWVS